jgi:hypothetical protein
MNKCPQNECENWNESKNECSLREYRSDDHYGPFLEGYNCILDEGLKNQFIQKNINKYNIDDIVYYFDSTNLDKYGKYEDSILKIKIKNMSYCPPAHQYSYDIGVPSGVNGFTGRNEDDLYATYEECYNNPQSQKTWNNRCDWQQKIKTDKIKEINNIKILNKI